MIAIRPIQGAFFLGAGDAGCGDGFYVDVGEVGGGVDVFGDGEGDGGHGDGFADEPAYALLCGVSRVVGGGGGWVVGGSGGRKVPFGGYSRCHLRGSCSVLAIREGMVEQPGGRIAERGEGVP